LIILFHSNEVPMFNAKLLLIHVSLFVKLNGVGNYTKIITQ